MVSRSLVFYGYSKSDKVALGVRLNKLTPTTNGALSGQEAQSRFRALRSVRSSRHSSSFILATGLSRERRGDNRQPCKCERTSSHLMLIHPAMNRPVRTRMRGGAESGREKLPLTRLYCDFYAPSYSFPRTHRSDSYDRTVMSTFSPDGSIW